MTSSKTKRYLFLYMSFLIYSSSSVLAKLAGAHSLLSSKSILLYGSCLLVLGIYAILWQQILKHFPLTIAYSNKALTIPLGILWGVFIFGETIKWNMVLGAVIIITGIMLVVRRND